MKIIILSLLLIGCVYDIKATQIEAGAKACEGLKGLDRIVVNEDGPRFWCKDGTVLDMRSSK